MLLIRHDIAEDREIFAQTGKADRYRPLTMRGRKRMNKTASLLQNLFPKFDVLATSTYKRAHQTAEILQKSYKHRKQIQLLKELEIDAHPDSFLEWLQKTAKRNQIIAAVGHNPHLPELATYMIDAKMKTLFALKKGGLVLIEFPGIIKPAGGKMVLLLQPDQLRKITRAKES